MTEKRQLEATDYSSIVETSKKSNTSLLMPFDEVAVIIESGDSEKLKEIIESGRMIDINMNVCSKENESLLMIACKSGFIECARVLIDHNADIGYSTRNGSVLKSACLSENIDMLKFIIERGAAVTDDIILCIFKTDEIIANVDITTALVGCIHVNRTGIDTHSLYHVCRVGNHIVARILLERGAVCSPNLDPLRIASRNGHVEVVKLLLGWNTSTVTITIERLKEALKLASRYGHIEVMRKLIEHGTSVDALNIALCQAIEGQHTEAITLLFDSGADFISHIAQLGCDAWIFACRRGNLSMVQLLLDRGADPNAVESDGGLTPLMISLLFPGVIRVLLECGADPNRPFLDGSTALLDLVRSQERDSMEGITVLLGHEADPNLAHATTGETALMIAAVAEYGDLHIDLVKLLLEYGADVTQVNRVGECVLDMLDDGHRDDYGEVRELCLAYIECNKPGAKLLLK